MLTLTSPVDTALHRLPAGAKLLALCVATYGLFSLNDPRALGLACVAVILLHLAHGRAFARHALGLLRPLWPFVLVITVWHLWLDDALSGLSILLRLVTAVAIANLVTMTTRLSDMIATLERLGKPLARLGFQPRRLALALALVIRFLPVLSIRLVQITEAFRARSPRHPGHRILIPATLAALDDAEHVAEALRARGGAG